MYFSILPNCYTPSSPMWSLFLGIAFFNLETFCCLIQVNLTQNMVKNLIFDPLICHFNNFYLSPNAEEGFPNWGSKIVKFTKLNKLNYNVSGCPIHNFIGLYLFLTSCKTKFWQNYLKSLWDCYLRVS